MSGFEVFGKKSKATEKKEAVKEIIDSFDNMGFVEVDSKRKKNIVTELSDHEKEVFNKQIDMASKLAINARKTAVMEAMLVLFKRMLHKYGWTKDSLDKFEKSDIKLCKKVLKEYLFKYSDNNQYDMFYGIGELLASDDFKELTFQNKLLIINSCCDELNLMIKQLEGVEKRNIFYTKDGEEIRAGGVFLYKVENGEIKILMSYDLKEKYYSDLGGKSDYFDNSPEEMVTREVYEETNALINRDELDERLQDNYIYISKAKYILYYVKANEYESSLKPIDFDTKEIISPENIRSITWMNLKDLNRLALHPRISEQNVITELKRQISYSASEDIEPTKVFKTHDGNDIFGAGVVIYKTGKNNIILLLLEYDSEFEEYSDIGGKVESRDSQPEDTVNRKLSEDTGRIIQSVDDRLNSNWIYVNPSKYVLYYVRANLHESELLESSFRNPKKSFVWVPLLDLNKIKLSERMGDVVHLRELRKQIENDVYDLDNI